MPPKLRTSTSSCPTQSALSPRRRLDLPSTKIQTRAPRIACVMNLPIGDARLVLPSLQLTARLVYSSRIHELREHPRREERRDRHRYAQSPAAAQRALLRPREGNRAGAG